MLAEFELPPEEPNFGPWHAEPVEALVFRLVGETLLGDGRPAILAIDGRSSSGKTSLSRRVARLLPDVALIHTDDIAWNHSRFGWSDLLVAGVLRPLRAGHDVRYRPPAWRRHGRSGVIEVRQESSLAIVEGVGASRGEFAGLLDAWLWVQADLRDVARRNAERVASGEASVEGVAGWMDEEFRFLEQDRPWERAPAVVSGSPVIAHDPVREVQVGGVQR